VELNNEGSKNNPAIMKIANQKNGDLFVGDDGVFFS
jgi:hypothetical protein